MAGVVEWGLLVIFTLCGVNGDSPLYSNEPALRCPPDADPKRCIFKGHQTDEYLFNIDGNNLSVTYGVAYFQMPCLKGVPLDSNLLPSFGRVTAVPRLTLRGCALPEGPLAEVLTARNLSLPAISTLNLYNIPPDSNALTQDHFHLLNLTILSVTSEAPLSVSADFLRNLTLSDLRLVNVNLTSDSLHQLPQTLRLLSIKRSDLEDLPVIALKRFITLNRLEVESKRLHSAPLQVVASLRSVEIRAPLVELTVGAELKNASFSLAAPAPGGSCFVERLMLFGVEEHILQAWLQRCSNIHTLVYRCAAGGSVGREPLQGSGVKTLREFHVRNCRLRDVEPRWLAAATGLLVLDLSSNKIEALPAELVVTCEGLQEASLRNSGAKKADVRALTTATTLRSLDLSYNQLGDLCPTAAEHNPNAVSLLSRLVELRKLELLNTGVTRLCADWRRDLAWLSDLNLRYNNITELQREDFKWRREITSTIDLRNNPIHGLVYASREYRASRESGETASVTIELDSELQCDCGMYWYARSLQDRGGAPARVSLGPLVCTGGTALEDMSLEELVCTVPSPPCPKDCICTAHGGGITVRCNQVGMKRPPDLPSDLSSITLLDLAHNNITEMPTAVMLPTGIMMLNLSYNDLERVNSEAVSSYLGKPGRQLWLAGNPFLCTCENVDGLSALRANSASVSDWEALRCTDGKAIAGVEITTLCTSSLTFSAPLATLCVAAVLALVSVAVFLASPRVRKHIKWLLWRRWPDGWDEEEKDDTNYEYDAFVSFSHCERERAQVVASRLEGMGRRLCVHHRDWRPGELITAQIVSSVHSSRRTIVLLSDQYLASPWPRAEFRTACAHAQRSTSARLVLVLLPELSALPEALSSHPDLAAFVASNTYLEWEDPFFWEKLERAVPVPKVEPITRY
ncbi:unnamed protein product [Leptosia nina]|uniref:TIR domain-containing protein n=1 Tax=Leptosia nina TaxID=320188 RepID=A0AAV1IVG7_9NEOP